MNSVPENGDVIIHYYLPSGARLELQIYFSKGENPEKVLQRLFESESVTCAIIPDLLRMLFDLFQLHRRTHVTSIPKPISFANAKQDHIWKKYSLIFQNNESLRGLRCVELELSRNTRKSIDKRKTLLIEEEARYSDDVANGIDSSQQHQIILDEIETEFLKTQQKVRQDFWKYVISAEVPKTVDLIDDTPKNPNIKEITISLGAQEKHKFVIYLQVSDDICCVPSLPIIETKDPEEIYLVHPQNVYKRYITCVVLAYTLQKTVQILPELIRKSEETPEFHFDSVREQISKAKIDEESIFFTRHSNTEVVQGAFHLPDPSKIPSIIKFSNLHGVKQLVFPIYHWEQISPVGLIGIIRSTLAVCPIGDLEFITFLLETNEDVNDVLNGIKLVFAESIISIS
jgi:hypothetical protein